MNPKIYLRKYQDIKKDIRNLEAEIKELETMATSCTAPTDTIAVQSGVSDKLSELVAQICDKTILVMDKRTKCFETLGEIERTIQQVKNATYRELLHKRYIENKVWEIIAVEMIYSYRQTTRIHGEALLEVDKIINKKNNVL